MVGAGGDTTVGGWDGGDGAGGGLLVPAGGLFVSGEPDPEPEGGPPVELEDGPLEEPLCAVVEECLEWCGRVAGAGRAGIGAM